MKTRKSTINFLLLLIFLTHETRGGRRADFSAMSKEVLLSNCKELFLFSGSVALNLVLRRVSGFLLFCSQAVLGEMATACI